MDRDSGSSRVGVDTPGHQALRRSRTSLKGWTYVLTCCTQGRRPMLTDCGVPERIAEELLAFETRVDADIQAYVIMPDHLHMMLKIRGESRLGDVVRQMKSILGRAINQRLGTQGPVWQPAYYDHAIRYQDEYEYQLRYLWENPVRAGLVSRPEDYPWCSLNLG